MDEPQDSQVSALVATRMARQSVLAGRNAPSLHVIIDEMALHRPIGSPGVMRRQLQHLLASAQRPNVTVQAVPISVRATTALEGPMVLIDLIDGSSVVHLEPASPAVFCPRTCISADRHDRRQDARRRRCMMTAMALPSAEWRKSSFSSSTNCLEVAFAEPHTVAVRDSKNTAGPTLTVPTATWHSFLTNVTP